MKIKSDEQLKELMGTPEFWTKPLEKLLAKTNISKEDKNKLKNYYSFEKNDLIDALVNGEYTWSIPKKVLIKKHGTNKFRTVYVYSTKDRLLLGVLYHTLSKLFKDKISKYCYSYKEGVNTAKAIKFIRDYQPNGMYGVKVDIHAYFNSVSKERLKQMIDELFPEKTGLKQTLEDLFYDDHCIYQSEIIEEYKALIPGTPIASFLANYCLRELDEYFEREGVLYARYSDDIIVMRDTKEEIEKDITVINEFIEKYGLEINPEKYEYFTPDDDITFLGLKLGKDGVIDISDHSKKKIKKYIHNLCKKARKRLEIEGLDYLSMAAFVCHKLNHKNFKCYLQHENTFGWCHYAFRYITTTKSLEEIDNYTKERLRYLKTGRNIKSNVYKMSDEEFKEMGWVSLTQLYELYKTDFDYYCEIIDLI